MNYVEAGVREYYRPLIARAEESGDHETAAFLRRFMLFQVELARAFDSGTDPDEMLPQLKFLVDICVLTDERQSQRYRLKAAELILTEHIKNPLFFKRFKLLESDIRRFADMHTKSIKAELSDRAKANLFPAAKDAIRLANKQPKSFVSQLQADHQALWRKLNDLIADDFAPGWREHEGVRKRKKAKKPTDVKRPDDDGITASPKQSREKICDTNDIHEMIENKEMADYAVAELAAIANKPEHEVWDAIDRAQTKGELAKNLGIGRTTLHEHFSSLCAKLQS